MGDRNRLLLCLFVLFVAIGNVNSIHRNTVDVTRTRSGMNQQPDVRRLGPNRSQQTSRPLHRRIHSNQFQRREPVGPNVIDQPRFERPVLPAHAHTASQKNAHVDLPGEHGNHSPFPVVHRERSTGSRSGGNQGNHGVAHIQKEPPVVFLNRERIRRQNRLRMESMQRQNPAPPDVEPSTFEPGANHFPRGQFPFPIGQTQRAPPSNAFDRHIQDTRRFPEPPSPYNQYSIYTPGGEYLTGMTSYPERLGDPFPNRGAPPMDNTMRQEPQNYQQIMESVDQMLDALPIPMRRMLRMRRRMRRLRMLERFGRFRMGQDAPPYNQYSMFPPLSLPHGIHTPPML